jgi:hypothetical protein
MCTIVTTVLQWQYLQTELILWIHLVSREGEEIIENCLNIFLDCSMAGLAERSSLAHSLHYKEVCLTATVK